MPKVSFHINIKNWHEVYFEKLFLFVTSFIINIYYVRIIYYSLINLKKYFNICVSNQPSNKANIHRYLQYFLSMNKINNHKTQMYIFTKIVDNELKEAWYPRMFISSVLSVFVWCVFPVNHVLWRLLPLLAPVYM